MPRRPPTRLQWPLFSPISATVCTSGTYPTMRITVPRVDVFSKLNDRYREVHTLRKSSHGQQTQSPSGAPRSGPSTPISGSPRMSHVQAGPGDRLPPFPQTPPRVSPDTSPGPNTNSPSGPRLSAEQRPVLNVPRNTPPGSPGVGACPSFAMRSSLNVGNAPRRPSGSGPTIPRVSQGVPGRGPPPANRPASPPPPSTAPIPAFKLSRTGDMGAPDVCYRSKLRLCV